MKTVRNGDESDILMGTTVSGGRTVDVVYRTRSADNYQISVADTEQVEKVLTSIRKPFDLYFSASRFYSCIDQLRKISGEKLRLTGKSWRFLDAGLYQVKQYKDGDSNRVGFIRLNVSESRNNSILIVDKANLYIVGFCIIISNTLKIFLTDDVNPKRIEKGKKKEEQNKQRDDALTLHNTIIDSIIDKGEENDEIKQYVNRLRKENPRDKSDNHIIKGNIIYLGNNGSYKELGDDGAVPASILNTFIEGIKKIYGYSKNIVDAEETPDVIQRAKKEVNLFLAMAAKCVSEAIRFRCVQDRVIGKESLYTDGIINDWSKLSKRMWEFENPNLYPIPDPKKASTTQEYGQKYIKEEGRALKILGLIKRNNEL